MKYLLGLIFFAVTIAGGIHAVPPSNKTCEEYYNEYYKPRFQIAHEDWVNYEIQIAYSPSLETCLFAAARKTGTEFFVTDMTLDFMKVQLTSQLFHCNADGVNSVLPEKVRKYKGRVSNVNYSKWMDNAEGGPAKTVKSAPAPYIRTRCESLFTKAFEKYKQ